MISTTTLFGLSSVVLIGLGLFGLIVDPRPLRKILAFNLIGSGVFLLFGVIARRGAGAGLNSDPMPQALHYLKESPSQTAGPYVHIGLAPGAVE